MPHTAQSMVLGRSAMCGIRRIVNVKGIPYRRTMCTGDGKKESTAVVTAKAMSIGTGAGFFGSLVGLGGGFVAVPSLTGWLRLTQHQAHGTSLGAVFATGAAGSYAYALSGHVDYRAAAAMAVGGIVGAHAGARTTAGISPAALKLALGVLMIGVAPLLPLRDNLRESSSSSSDRSARSAGVEEGFSSVLAVRAEPFAMKEAESNSGGVACVQAETSGVGRSPGVATAVKLGSVRDQLENAPVRGKVADPASSSLAYRSALVASDSAGDSVVIPGMAKMVKMTAIGLGSGFLAGVFGVGGGVITVPAISLATDLSHKEVLGTSLAAMVLPALTGSVTHFRQGNLLPKIAGPLAVGTSLGAFLGGNYAARHLDDTSLKWAFAAMMLVMGGRTVAVARAAFLTAKAAKPKL